MEHVTLPLGNWDFDALDKIKADKEEAIELRFKAPKSIKCCNYSHLDLSGNVQCSHCEHIHNDRSRVLVAKHSMFGCGAIKIEKCTGYEASSRGVCVLYAISSKISGEHIADIGALSCRYTQVQFSTPSKANSEKGIELASIKVTALNDVDSNGAYKWNPILIVMSKPGEQWSAFQTAVICAKNSNARCGDMFFRKKPKDIETANIRENRSHITKMLAKSHAACLSIRKSRSFEEMVSILHDVYTERLESSSS